MASGTTIHTVEKVDAVWLNETSFCSIEELVSLSGLSAAELDHLVEMGLITANSTADGNLLFQQHYLVIARTARRLRDDFELDPAGLGVAVRLLQRIQELETQLSAAQAQLMHGKLSSDIAGEA
ncbi:hypothetical protein GCM10011396_05840 [Undibacterium terreum]|uniref:Chaperone modulatory protein CbpM n=2 Tax=Undibacterium terreum TaxID=1224302 RepID=A0A916U788_9BURK|nr:hypothetical protein GCM10011396_05840 [Undibacterium terreum]